MTETTDAAEPAATEAVPPAADLADIDADQLAALAAGATDEQLVEGAAA